MSLKKINDIQPEFFTFSEKNSKKADEILKKYPADRKESALMPFLYLVQKQNDNWIPLAGMKYVAKLLNIPYIKVYEVATFYSMFNLSPVGKFFVQVCTTTPCMIRGSNKILSICKKYISKEKNQLSKNNLCSWTEVECLGACVNAPMMQINDDYYEDLDEKKAEEIIKSLINDKNPKSGSYKNRTNSAPVSGRTTLKDNKNA